jgi:hypothetical protein
MTKDEALKLALEALESADWYINQLEITLYSADDAGTHEDRLKVQQAITVLRLEIDAQNMLSKPVPENFIDALRFDTAVRDAAPVQEPVAIALNTGTKQGVKWLKNVEHGVNLYTTPPAAQRQWVGLTDDEMKNALVSVDAETKRLPPGMKAFARAIEAKLKEKNTWVGLTRWEIDAKLKEKNEM